MDCLSEQKLRMQILTTEKEKDAAYHLRHQVFAEELGWLPSNKNKREIDTYDDNCVLLGLYANNHLIACLRILLPDQQFMIEKEFRVMIGNHSIVKTNKTIEVSRFCLARDMRRSSVSTQHGTFPMVMALEKTFYNWCRINDFDNVYMVVSKHFFRLLNLLGMPCRAVAPEITMPDGVVAIAAISSWTAFENYNREKNSSLLDWFTDCEQINLKEMAA